MDITDVPKNCFIATPEELARLGVKIDNVATTKEKNSETEHGKHLVNDISNEVQTPIRSIFDEKNKRLVRLAISDLLAKSAKKGITSFTNTNDKNNCLSEEGIKNGVNTNRVGPTESQRNETTNFKPITGENSPPASKETNPNLLNQQSQPGRSFNLTIEPNTMQKARQKVPEEISGSSASQNFDLSTGHLKPQTTNYIVEGSPARKSINVLSNTKVYIPTFDLRKLVPLGNQQKLIEADVSKQGEDSQDADTTSVELNDNTQRSLNSNISNIRQIQTNDNLYKPTLESKEGNWRQQNNSFASYTAAEISSDGARDVTKGYDQLAVSSNVVQGWIVQNSNTTSPKRTNNTEQHSSTEILLGKNVINVENQPSMQNEECNPGKKGGTSTTYTLSENSTSSCNDKIIISRGTSPVAHSNHAQVQKPFSMTSNFEKFSVAVKEPKENIPKRDTQSGTESINSSNGGEQFSISVTEELSTDEERKRIVKHNLNKLLKTNESFYKPTLESKEDNWRQQNNSFASYTAAEISSDGAQDVTKGHDQLALSSNVVQGWIVQNSNITSPKPTIDTEQHSSTQILLGKNIINVENQRSLQNEESDPGKKGATSNTYILSEDPTSNCDKISISRGTSPVAKNLAHSNQAQVQKPFSMTLNFEKFSVAVKELKENIPKPETQSGKENVNSSNLEGQFSISATEELLTDEERKRIVRHNLNKLLRTGNVSHKLKDKSSTEILEKGIVIPDNRGIDKTNAAEQNKQLGNSNSNSHLAWVDDVLEEFLAKNCDNNEKVIHSNTHKSLENVYEYSTSSNGIESRVEDNESNTSVSEENLPTYIHSFNQKVQYSENEHVLNIRMIDNKKDDFASKKNLHECNVSNNISGCIDEESQDVQMEIPSCECTDYDKDISSCTTSIDYKDSDKCINVNQGFPETACLLPETPVPDLTKINLLNLLSAGQGKVVTRTVKKTKRKSTINKTSTRKTKKPKTSKNYKVRSNRISKESDVEEQSLFGDRKDKTRKFDSIFNQGNECKKPTGQIILQIFKDGIEIEQNTNDVAENGATEETTDTSNIDSDTDDEYLVTETQFSKIKRKRSRLDSETDSEADIHLYKRSCTSPNTTGRTITRSMARCHRVNDKAINSTKFPINTEAVNALNQGKSEKVKSYTEPPKKPASNHTSISFQNDDSSANISAANSPSQEPDNIFLMLQPDPDLNESEANVNLINVPELTHSLPDCAGKIISDNNVLTENNLSKSVSSTETTMLVLNELEPELEPHVNLNVSNSIDTSILVKKPGRGRPKKSVINSSLNANTTLILNELEPPVKPDVFNSTDTSNLIKKRGRGRPKRSLVNSSLNEDTTLILNELEPELEPPVNLNVSDSIVTSILVKKPDRERPKKSLINSSLNENTTLILNELEPELEPPVNLNVSNNIDTSILVKKPDRGRSKKSLINSSLSENTTLILNELEPPVKPDVFNSTDTSNLIKKRGPGRPKKSYQMESLVDAKRNLAINEVNCMKKGDRSNISLFTAENTESPTRKELIDSHSDEDDFSPTQTSKGKFDKSQTIFDSDSDSEKCNNEESISNDCENSHVELDETNVETNVSNDSTSKSAKKRGRPRKTFTEALPKSDTQPYFVMETSTRGRKRKVVNYSLDNDDVEISDRKKTANKQYCRSKNNIVEAHIGVPEKTDIVEGEVENFVPEDEKNHLEDKYFMSIKEGKTSEESEQYSTSRPANKRGRPRKTFTEALPKSDTETNFVIETSSRGRKRKVINYSLDNDVEIIDSKKTTNNQYCGSKNNLIEEHIAVPVNRGNVEGEGEGFAPKVEYPLQDIPLEQTKIRESEESAQYSTTKPAKKRGRPIKTEALTKSDTKTNFVPEDEDLLEDKYFRSLEETKISEESEQNSTSKPAKKPGRPRKTVIEILPKSDTRTNFRPVDEDPLEEEAKTSEKSEQYSKNADRNSYKWTGHTATALKRIFNTLQGRDVTDISHDSQLGFVKRRRGRTKYKNDELSDEEGESFCMVCNETIINRDWLDHKRKVHYNLTWRRGDSLLDISDSTVVQKVLTELQKERGYLKCNKCSKKMRQVIVFIDHLEACNGIVNASGSVTCAVCKMVLVKHEWQYHKYREHNNLAWREGEQPLNLQDQDLVFRILQQLYRAKKPLHCEICKQQKKSVLGYLSHRSVCQVPACALDNLKVACSLCGKKVLPVSMDFHIKTHVKPSSYDVLEEPGYFDVSLDISGRRKAATQALNIIKSIKTEFVGSTMYYASQCDFQDDFVISELKRRTAQCSALSCLFSNCEFQASFVHDMVQHLNTCDKKPEEYFVCKLCLMLFREENDIKKHVKTVHNRVQAGDKDVEFVDEPEYCDSEDDQFIEAVEMEKKRLRQKGKLVVMNNQRAKPLFLIHPVKEHLNAIVYPQAYMWMYNFCETHYTNLNLFQIFRNSKSWQAVDCDILNDYLPRLHESCDITVKALTVKEQLNQTEESNFTNFGLFEVRNFYKGEATIYCGGPISALAWLPTPYNNENQNQILAVAALNEPEKEYKVGETYNEPYVIQFWSVGALDWHQVEASDFKPFLLFGLALTTGPVWHLEWCPSGCLDLPGAQDCDRLGLLAVATSDSFAYIYCIDDVKDEGDRGLIYKGEPVVKLQLEIESSTLVQQYYATRISWTKAEGHRYVAVGYSTGMIALFDLLSLSPLLQRQDRGGTQIILPYQIFQGHMSCITGLTLGQYGDGKRWCFSAAMDKCYTFWDLSKTTKVTSLRKYGIAEGLWLIQWPVCLIAEDESSYNDIAQAHSYVRSIREVMGPDSCSYTFSPSGINSISFSDWLNLIVHGSNAGEVLAQFSHRLFFNVDNKHIRRSYTKCVFSAAKLTKKNHSRDTTHQSSTYEEATSNYGITFVDYNSENLSMIPNSKTNDAKIGLEKYNVHDYPLQAVNKVAVNPNPQACTFYAAGYQAGFVRIRAMEFLKNYFKPTTFAGHNFSVNL